MRTPVACAVPSLAMRIVLRTSLPGVTCAEPSSVSVLRASRKRGDERTVSVRSNVREPVDHCSEPATGSGVPSTAGETTYASIAASTRRPASMRANTNEPGRVAFADGPAVGRARARRVAQAFGQRQANARVFRGAGAVVFGDQADAHAAAGFDLAGRVDDEPGRFRVEAACAADRELRAGQLELRGLRRRDRAAQHDARVVVERRVDAGAVFDHQRRSGGERG